MEKGDEQLIADCREGDKKAFDILLGRYLKPIYNFVYRLVGNADDAEDIAQEAFMRAWKHIGRYNAAQSFKTWLYAIARNAAIDWLRKKKNAVFSDFEDKEGENNLTDTLNDPEPLPDEMMARAEDAQFIDVLLAQLAPIYREVLTLRYNDHLTFEEMGEILRAPRDTVKSRHRRALIALRKLFATAR